MKKNMGSIDRIVRISLAFVIAVLYYGGYISGVATIVLGVVALAFLVTSVIGWCPAYLPFGITTCRKE